MKRFGSIFVILLALLCISLGVGCSKPRVELAVASQPNVNPDHSNRPSPVIVKVYELRNDLAFKQAEFSRLFDTPLQVLGADLIATDELVFIPGEARRVAYQPNPNTRFVGVVAGFRQMDRAVWRMIKPVDPEKGNWLAFELNDATILIVPDKQAENWDPEKAVRQFQQQQQAKPQQPSATAPPPDTATNPGTMPPTQPAQSSPRVTPYGTQPSPNPIATAVDDAGREVGARAAQAPKEALTVTTQNGAEALPNTAGLGTPSAPSVPVAPSVPTPSLPSMRPF